MRPARGIAARFRFDDTRLGIHPRLLPARTEGARRARLFDLLVRPAERLAQHLLGVLADGRRLGRHRHLLTDELDRRRQHVGTDRFLGQQRHAVLELRVVEQRLGRVRHHDRRVVLEPEGEPFLRRPLLELVAQDRCAARCCRRVVAVLRAGPLLEEVFAADAGAEVLPELALTRHEQHEPVGRFVEVVTHARFHAGRARRASFEVVGFVAGDLRFGPFVRAPGLAAQPVDCGGRVGLRELQLATFAGFTRAQHAGEQAERAEHRTGVDADRHVLGHVCEPVVVDLGTDDAGPHVVRDAVARHVAVRTGHAVAGDRAEHDLRIDLLQLVEPEPAACESARSHRLDDCVGILHQLEERFLAGVGAEVEHDALLAAADVQEQQRDAFDDRPRHAAAVVALRRFDLDHVGAEIGKVRGEVARTEHRHFDDAQAREWSRSFLRHARTFAHATAARPSGAPSISRRAGVAWCCRRCRSCRVRSRQRGRSGACRRSPGGRGSGDRPTAVCTHRGLP